MGVDMRTWMDTESLDNPRQKEKKEKRRRKFSNLE